MADRTKLGDVLMSIARSPEALKPMTPEQRLGLVRAAEALGSKSAPNEPQDYRWALRRLAERHAGCSIAEGACGSVDAMVLLAAAVQDLAAVEREAHLETKVVAESRQAAAEEIDSFLRGERPEIGEPEPEGLFTPEECAAVRWAIEDAVRTKWKAGQNAALKSALEKLTPRVQS